MANEVTADEATLIRATARDGLYGEFVYAPRIWMPIEYEDATGRAKCRACGTTIGKGERCIAFAFDPYGGKDSWGREPQKAYLHIQCEEARCSNRN